MFPVLILFRECWPGLVELSWSWVLRQWYVFINTTLVNTHLIVLMFHFSPPMISTDWWLSLRTWGEQSVVLSVFCYLIRTLNTDLRPLLCCVFNWYPVTQLQEQIHWRNSNFREDISEMLWFMHRALTLGCN